VTIRGRVVNTREEIWLGLDLGTQSARALAVAADGEVLASASRPLASRRDGARHEQAPEDWWDALTAACRAAVALIPGVAIRAAAVCGTSGTVLLVDARGDPVTNALMYDDSRATAEAELANRVGAEVWQALGYARMQASWALPKLLWLLREHAAGDVRLAHQPDFINARLAGRDVQADWSHALKTGYHVIDRCWPGDVFGRLRIPEGVVPPVVPPGSRLGTVCAAAAEATGIPAGTPLIAGMTDGCAAQLAAGSLAPGSWNSVLGTTLVLKGVTRELIHDPLGVVYSHRLPDGGWLPGGASSVGAGVLTARYDGRDLTALDRAAADREPATVIAYPLVSRGERFPFTAPEAEGFVLGEPVDEADRYAALLQGVAYTERLIFDYLDRLGAPTGGQLMLTGGGARSRYWCQLRADVLGRPVDIPRHAEAALGMAALAAAGTTGRPLADIAAQMVELGDRLEPRTEGWARFREPYLRFVGELEARGWLDPAVAEHSRRRAAQ
jgi:sugar (pentulose or hexulose) kinase